MTSVKLQNVQSPKKESTTTTTTDVLSSPEGSRNSNDSIHSEDSEDSFLRDLERDQVHRDSTPDLANPAINQGQKTFKLDKNSRYALIAVWIGNFLCALDGTIVSTTMSNIASDFGQSNLVSWIAVSYLLTSTSFQPLYGKTSDIIGRKTLLIIAQALFGLGILLSGISTNVETLSLSRALSGIGGSGMMTLTSIIISDVVPLSQRPMYSAYGSVVDNTSKMLGGPLGGLCIATIGWRWMFLSQVPLVLICIGITSFVEIKVDHIPEGPERFSKKNLKRIDLGGIITSNFLVSSIIFLVSDDGGYPTYFKNILYITLFSSIIGYIYVERYIAVETLIEPKLVNGQIGILGLVNGVQSLLFYFVLFMTPLYLQLIQHINVTQIGFYTMFCVVSTAVGSVLTGLLLKRYNSSEESIIKAGIWLNLITFIGQIGGFTILYLVNEYVPPIEERFYWKLLLIIGLIISGLGVGASGPGCSIFVFGKAGRKDQASAFTVINVIKSLGNVLGISLSLSVYTRELFKRLYGFLGKDQSELVKKLIKDSSYIYNGLDQQYLKEVLGIYRVSLVTAYHPIFILSLLALIIMFLLNRSVQKCLKIILG
ncbi:putative membrane protein [Wickerhamomyces ciferrii]|uniref:Membrane protein n=1 Tax=Wickerhamomyces ciferrii (strain ATCC 14091 / BCRC 22168 / CBS 111 / JCM 3599 / NBRC 0793 / NRRL Y-1031 F-60-10) TaxID=1206466 RepID=K0KQX4_WICCF|nr:uncharacterized protein BN7_4087 [Wickerhamomyces ciferrii]CCH44522.1 putative membrane protein [Wickerhamomyces ciferrii]